jgi:hypothetical protein
MGGAAGAPMFTGDLMTLETVCQRTSDYLLNAGQKLPKLPLARMNAGRLRGIDGLMVLLWPTTDG